MRKILKAQALKITEQLEQVHKKIKVMLRADKKEDALALLEKCQMAAIDLGETIEQEEGEGAPVVSLVEEYCEDIYQIYERLHGNYSIEGNQVWKKLQKILIRIENSIKTKIKTHIEILFLPYKAAMWDSLESIWKAADMDEDCRACVVPIPYYDKFPDGTLGQMHDEKHLYPNEIPVIDWHEYDIESRHPDAIFIHSPYDSGNFVTTIHPDFYSNRLKNYTELLIYVPYYVTLGTLTDELCITLGTLNADRVIVQSERVRQNYIDAFCKFEKEKKCEGFYGNAFQKFLALGSPKFDKVLYSEREDFELPEKWRTLIDTNGNPKKIVFYNTSLNAMLRGNEKYLDKLRSVLNTFQTQDDIVLWWRPHPLSEATISSMRPEFLKEYQQIMAKYQSQGWGIYDDTPDLHRAIIWSDAYYGDTSSVAALFQVAGKPVMLQSVEDTPLAFENFIQVDDDYWFTGFNINGLFRLDHKTWKADFMGCFPAEKDWRRLFFSICQYKNLLIFAPLSAEQIAIYRMDTSEFISIPLQEPEKLTKSQIQSFTDQGESLNVPYYKYRKFLVCAAYNGYAFLFPCTYPAVIKIHLETFEIEYLYEPIAELQKIIKHPQSYYFRKGDQQGNIIRLWYVAANAFVEFNMDTCRFKICGFVNDDETYVETVCDGTGYWLFPKNPSRKAKKISRDFQKNSFVDLSGGEISEKLPYLYAVDAGDDIYAFPSTAKHVMKIGKKQNCAKSFPILDSENVLTHSGSAASWQFFFAYKFGNTIFAYDAFSYKLLSYDLNTGNRKKERVYINHKTDADTESLLMVWEMYYERVNQIQKLAVREGRRKSLNNFLKLLSKKSPAFLASFHNAQKRLAENEEFPSVGNSGRSIYNYTKKYLLERQGGKL